MSRCFRCACTWCACIELSMFRYHSSRKGTSHTAQLSNSSEIKDVLEQLYGDFHDWTFINFPFPGQSQLALTALRSMEVDTALYHLYLRYLLSWYVTQDNLGWQKLGKWHFLELRVEFAPIQATWSEISPWKMIGEAAKGAPRCHSRTLRG